MSKKIKNKGVIVFLLGLLSAIGPFSIDMYLPGFEYIASDLNTTIDKVQLSLTSFFVGIAVGQMIYGPLLDRFGRRIPLMTGLFIYRSVEHTSELQSRFDLVCRLLLEKKNK